MTDIRTKTIAQLPLATAVSVTDKLVVWQDNVLKQTPATSIGSIAFASIASLRANTVIYGVNQNVFVKSYYANGTAGGGVFIRVADLASDNGGTVITDAAGQRWRRVWDGPVSVVHFGARGDGVTDDTASIQAAVNAVFPASYALAALSALYFPAGDYVISSGIIINQAQVNPAGQSPVHIFGDGVFSTRITAKPGSAVNAMFEFQSPTAPLSSSTWHTTISKMFLFGGGHANYGIAGFGEARTPYLNVEDVFIRDVLIDGIFIRDAYSLVLKSVIVRGAGRDGFHLANDSGAGQNNGANLIACVGWVCQRFGFYVEDSYAVHFNTCVSEGNAGGGLFIGPCQSVYVDNCYFEENGATGITYTSPTTINVKADIHISRSPTLISADFASNVTISNCFTSPNSAAEAFVFANGAVGLVVENNKRNSGSVVVYDLVRYFGSANTFPGTPGAGVPREVSIRNNINFTNDINIVNFPYGVLSYDDAPATVLISSAQTQNILSVDLNSWANVISGAVATTWRRSAVTFPFNPEVPVWEIDAASGTSDIIGFQINAANYPQYHNKLIVFAVWVKKNASGPVSNVVLFCSPGVETDSFTSNTDWRLETLVRKMPTTGTLTFGVQKIGDADTVQIVAPVLCEFGADLKALYGAYGRQAQFYGAAAPTVGTWKRGDMVFNTTPSAGGTPGWVCVTAGAPGTWKAMANLAP